MDYLERNISAFERLYPEWTRRICDAVGDQHLLRSDDGQIHYIHGLASYPLNLSSGSILVLTQSIPSASDIFLAGVGLGEHILPLLEHSATDTTWHIWDDDPCMWREALRRIDLRVHIFSGRIKPYLGVDLVKNRERLKQFPVLGHPVLQHFYGLHLNYLKTENRDKKCLLCEGELFVEDVAQTLGSRGYSIYPWATGRLSLPEMQRCLDVYEPDLIMAVNFRKGLGEISQISQVPVVCWEIDPAVDTPPQAPEDIEDLHIFTYRRPHIQHYQDSGYAQVQFLPLASNPATRHPLRENTETDSPYRNTVSFVGASMLDQGRLLLEEFIRQYPNLTQAGSQPRSENEIRDILKELVNHQREDLSSYQLDKTLWEALPELSAVVPGSIDPEKLVSEICAAHKRMDWLEALSPHTITVWGDRGWEECSNIDYRGTAGHGQELTLIYSNSLINIDIGRLYQNDIMTMRLFDVMACEGFLLTEKTDEIMRWFEPGVHLDVYENPEQLAEKIEFYKSNPELAQAIGKAARQKILEEHTFDKRFDTILSSLGS